MWSYHPELLATPVPRYTSFPTAAEFTPGVGAEDFEQALGQLAGDLSLYIHIPFCEKICWYCGCNTAAANRPQRLASYLDALHREIALVAAQVPEGVQVRRIAFGGGSPNALPPAEFVRLFDALVLHFAPGAPTISVELDPRTLTEAWVPVLRSIGATHASMGVQTFAPQLQEAIGRVQPLCMIDRGVRILRRAGIESLNFDLMYGLPGQSRTDLAESLTLTERFGADRVALFGYAHVPGLIPRQRRIDAHALPGPSERFAMAQAGWEHLTGAGYVPVGFDHFALPGDALAQAATAGRLHRNFQGFTEDAAGAVIGLGASAISSFPGLLAQNEKNSGRYRMLLSQDRLATALGHRRTRDDRRRGALIEQLLCSGRARVGRDLLEAAWGRLAPYAEHGLLEVDAGGVLIVPPRALPYARSIAAAFDPYRAHDPQRFSSAV